ncbi:hypothetical protein [Pontibacillus litoralis]|uniref:Uncharacterized protein n=1 Tax=Pontibacillus litoralis JSM 072002 TaxID=1385512 RepID=A0A0A5FYI7_9BACI|nr:hypothetical protein [Pontibacillus litoralis]KGX85881.1 hypothetical protein N784_06645 [Pontibacillus litoralis JSM 072002]
MGSTILFFSLLVFTFVLIQRMKVSCVIEDGQLIITQGFSKNAIYIQINEIKSISEASWGRTPSDAQQIGSPSFRNNALVLELKDGNVLVVHLEHNAKLLHDLEMKNSTMEVNEC